MTRKPPAEDPPSDKSPEKKAPGEKPAKNRSWLPGQKGQGGEGLSKGYGGSEGSGTGPSGPDRKR